MLQVKSESNTNGVIGETADYGNAEPHHLKESRYPTKGT